MLDTAIGNPVLNENQIPLFGKAKTGMIRRTLKKMRFIMESPRL